MSHQSRDIVNCKYKEQWMKIYKRPPTAEKTGAILVNFSYTLFVIIICYLLSFVSYLLFVIVNFI